MSFHVPKYSNAFEEYCHNRHEVIEILRVAPPDSEQLTSPRKRELANALHRGSVMLLSGHLEKYVESLVVEAIDSINTAAPPVLRIPEPLRMIQVEDSLFSGWSGAQKDRKRTMNSIKTSVSTYPWIWNDKDPCGKMSGDVLIGENKFSNPSPNKIKDLFTYFGIENVVSTALSLYEIANRDLIEIKVNELVQKRNVIAHTASTPSLTRQDVVDYLINSRRLVRGLDIIVGNQINAIIGNWPWR